MKKIGIIGGGFTGTAVAIQLIKNATQPCEITIFSDEETFTKGIAYTPYSKKHILNVTTNKMSAFPDNPDDFLDWVMQRDEFKNQDRLIIANSFMPRYLYGAYLRHTWERYASIANEKNIKITIKFEFITKVKLINKEFLLITESNDTILVDKCIIATGNLAPRNPKIEDNSFYQNAENYFQNPWKIESVQNTSDVSLPILIVGNGLTMVDTVIGLLESGFKGEIYSLSPNGFNILPHRHIGIKFSKIDDSILNKKTLLEIVNQINKHRKEVRGVGFSAEPVIDSLRPYTQRLWHQLPVEQKKLFMSRLRHLWGVARHRIPLHIHDLIQDLRIKGKLKIVSGDLKNLTSIGDNILVKYFDKKDRELKTLEVARVINCTGPESNLELVNRHFLGTYTNKK